MRWVPVEEAARLLTYSRDKQTLDDALVHPKPTTPLVLLRHAKALPRKQWKGDDRLARSTTRAGARRAAIGPVLAAYGVTRVVTSTSTRCLQTVAAYAEEHVLAITRTGVLTEEHEPNPGDARRWSRGCSPTTSRPWCAATGRCCPALLEAVGSTCRR